MFLVIGVWGSRVERVVAAYQFFFYTLIGSLFMLKNFFLIAVNVFVILSLFLSCSKSDDDVVIW